MDLAVMRTFFQTAPLVYATMARLAAENRTEDGLEELRAAQAAFVAAMAGDRAGDAALENHRFHAAIGAMAGNLYLEPALARLLIDQTRMSQTFYRPDSPAERDRVKTAVRQHDAMIAANDASTVCIATK